LILGKIIKTVATRCHTLKLKCSAPPQNPLAGFKGPTSKGRQGINFTRGKGTGRSEGRGPTSDDRGDRGKLLPGAEGDRRPWIDLP